MGSGLVLGWLMRNGQRPELGLHFVGIGLGIVVSAIGASSLVSVCCSKLSKVSVGDNLGVNV